MNKHSASQMTTAAHAEPATGAVDTPARRILILRTRLAGVRFHAEPEIFDRLRPGDALALAREPENPHDADAVRADWRDHLIGYLPSDHNHAPARLLDAGERLEGRIVEIDIEQRPKWPVAVDVFLAVPDGNVTEAPT
ncbi:MAG: HIRAN domain-containing protein [Wenzhouxiangellaceae bacterium]